MLAEAGGGIYSHITSKEDMEKILPKLTDPSHVSTQKVQENIQIILDLSENMKTSFDGSTKIDAAVSALHEILDLQVADRDNLALRKFGGLCGENNTQLVEKFSLNNVGKIREKLREVRTRIRGKTTLVSAVLEAIEDFNDPRRFDGINKRVVIVTGEIDSCPNKYPRPDELIKEQLRRSQIKPDFVFIGMKIPPDKRNQLNSIIQSTSGHSFFVTNKEE
jgi:von Willebrand factor type A domain